MLHHTPLPPPHYRLQAVFDHSYGSDVPVGVREGCTAHNISLLNAEECLFYRYNRLEWIKYIWAIGLLAAGQSSTMTVCVHVHVHIHVHVAACKVKQWTTLCHSNVYNNDYCMAENFQGRKLLQISKK